ncbi:MAG: 2'-5' RNA ligase family protein [Candidatus Rokubacteria bacterium]|nr:2'-5' RNA ligase family protein [Candidatus Rokubacteria bacterium]
MPHTDHHATIFVPADAAEAIEAVRLEWDPDMAAQIAAHLTLVYPHEAPDIDLLTTRLQAQALSTAPFRLRLGGLGCFDRPEGGVYIDVKDLDGGCRRLREQLLYPPLRRSTFPLHVTIAHPRTARRLRELWESNAYRRSNAEFTVREIAITAFDGTRWETLSRYPLTRR